MYMLCYLWKSCAAKSTQQNLNNNKRNSSIVNNKQQLQIPNRYFTKLTLALQSVI